jgi:threonine aldolase
MRRAMLEAELGDDVFGDDPTVNRLQARAAESFGFEAALFFPSGTQSNFAALMSHCQRGDEVILGQEAHSYRYEAGGAAVLGSIQPQAIANRPDGTLDLAEVEAAIKPDDPHFARTRLRASSMPRLTSERASRRCARDSTRCRPAFRRAWARRRAPCCSAEPISFRMPEERARSSVVG